jgi:hypothetical protein
VPDPPAGGITFRTLKPSYGEIAPRPTNNSTTYQGNHYDQDRAFNPHPDSFPQVLNLTKRL